MSWTIDDTNGVIACRWIDERKGILEVVFNNKPEWRLSFHDMTYKSYYYRIMLDNTGSVPTTGKFCILNGVFCHSPDEGADVTSILFDGIVNNLVFPYYEKWLNRVMLADDISESKRSAKKRENSGKDTGSDPSFSGSRDERSLHKAGNDGDDGRVPLRETEGNIPVVSREKSWTIRRR